MASNVFFLTMEFWGFVLNGYGGDVKRRDLSMYREKRRQGKRCSILEISCGYSWFVV